MMKTTFKDQLKQWEKQHIQQIESGRNKEKKRKEEHLSRSDLRSLMGENRATYVRGKGGAFRQRG